MFNFWHYWCIQIWSVYFIVVIKHVPLKIYLVSTIPEKYRPGGFHMKIECATTLQWWRYNCLLCHHTVKLHCQLYTNILVKIFREKGRYYPHHRDLISHFLSAKPKDARFNLSVYHPQFLDIREISKISNVTSVAGKQNNAAPFNHWCIWSYNSIPEIDVIIVVKLNSVLQTR